MAHKLLADAAIASDLPKTAILSLEIVFKNSPKDRDLATKLAELYTALGQTSKAEEFYKELLRANPHDPDLAQALKNLAAQKTMSEGGYDALSDGKGSYRDILKNKAEAVSLEPGATPSSVHTPSTPSPSCTVTFFPVTRVIRPVMRSPTATPWAN